MSSTFKQEAFALLDTIIWDEGYPWGISVRTFLESVPDSIEILLQSLSDATIPLDMRESLVWLVVRLSHPEVVPALVQCLMSEEATLRRSAGFALSGVSNCVPFAPIAAALAHESNPSVRVALVYALYHLPHPHVIPLLITMALDSNENSAVRCHAVEGLGEQVESWIGGKAENVIPTLLVTLFDPDPEIRYWSAFALSKTKDMSVIPALQSVITDHDAPVSAWNTSVAQEAQDAIERIRNRQVWELSG